MKFSIRLNDECGCALDLYEQGLSAEDLPFNITLESVDVDEDGTVVAKNLHYDIARPVINEEDSKELVSLRLTVGNGEHVLYLAHQLSLSHLSTPVSLSSTLSCHQDRTSSTSGSKGIRSTEVHGFRPSSRGRRVPVSVRLRAMVSAFATRRESTSLQSR